MKRFICAVIAVLLALSSVITASAVEEDTAPLAAEAEYAPTAEETEAAAEPEVSIPEIYSAAPVENGLKLSFTSFDGAYAYRVFMRKDDNSGWKKIADTFSLTYTHKNLVAYKDYLYTVRAIDSSGKFISGYNKEGFACTYLPSPLLINAENVYAGVRVNWQPVTGAGNYRVYLYTSSGWKGIADTDGTTYTYPGAVSANTYKFTVRVYDKENKAPLSYYDRTGVSSYFVSAPSITSFAPVDGGVKVSWDAVSGVAKYRLFIRKADDSGWKKLGDTTGTTYTHTGLSADTEYKYTVRSLDSKGNFISGYNSKGWVNRYFAPPVMKAADTDGGLTLNWEGSPYASAYRIYRKEFGGSWTAIARSYSTSYVDDTFEADKVYTYTVRCLNADGELMSYFNRDNPYYCNGVLADGKLNAGNTTVNFEKGFVRQGFITVDGKTYYYDSNGVLLKNGVVGSAADGYRYADKNGVIDPTARLAVTINGSDWNVLDGIAYKVTTAKDRTMSRALKLVAKITTPDMTKAQKLRACFDYLQTETYEYNPRVPHYRGMDWPVIYADDIFTTNGGNCISYGAAFGFMAKAIGYTNVYGCHSGGHGWTEIDGLVYDAEWQRSHHRYSYYGMRYEDDSDVGYAAVRRLYASNPWMHIEI